MYNLVWQSVMCRPGKRLILSHEEESDAAPNRSDRQTASAPSGKRVAGNHLTSGALRQTIPSAILILIVARLSP
jgi:hypothetical protein